MTRPSVGIRALLIVLAASACGADGSADVGNSSSGVAADTASGTPAPSAYGSAEPEESPSAEAETPAGPWVPACTLLTDADVVAATSGQQMIVSVVDSQENNEPFAGIRQSECRYKTEGTQQSADGGTVTVAGDNWVSLTIRETGASLIFPAPPEFETVTGVGDEAYWNDPGNSILEIRKGDAYLMVDSAAPCDSGADIGECRRAVTLKLALAVVDRMT